MDATAAHADLFVHLRIVIGVVMGLSITRLLTGVARFVQHPARQRLYLVHFGWVLFLLLSIVHFWWFEFGLSRIEQWTFELYFFVICYAILFFFIATLLFPDAMEEFSGHADYFHARQRWFYGFLSCIFLVDLVDTALKGMEHFQSLGIEYPIRQIIFFILSLIAIAVRNRRYHFTFVAVGLIYQASWILRQFEIWS